VRLDCLWLGGGSRARSDRPAPVSAYFARGSDMRGNSCLYWSITRLASPRSKREQVQYELGRVGPHKLAWFFLLVEIGSQSTANDRSRSMHPPRSPFRPVPRRGLRRCFNHPSSLIPARWQCRQWRKGGRHSAPCWSRFACSQAGLWPFSYCSLGRWRRSGENSRRQALEGVRAQESVFP
jgi:hypothetical protein